MAQAQPARFNNILDLTEDDDDPQLDSLSEAASRAQAAATRLTSQLQSMTSTPTNTQDGVVNGRPVSQTNAVASITNGVGPEPGKATASGTEVTLPNHAIRSGGREPTMGAFGSWADSENASSAAARSGPMDTSCSSKGTTDTGAAARSLGREILQNEEVIGRLGTLETQRVIHETSPKKLGRSEVQQRTPQLGSKTTKSASNDLLNSSILGVARAQVSLSIVQAESNMSGSDVARPVADPVVKRKRSGASFSLDASTKSAKMGTLQSMHSPGLPRILHNNDRTKPISGLGTTQGEPKNGLAAGNGGKRDQSLLSPGLDDNNLTISTGPKSLLSSFEDGPLFDLFKEVVYPALKRAMKRARQSLSEDKLMSIGKSVATEVVDQRLIAYVSQSQSLPNDVQKEDLKQFVKECFQGKVQEAVTRCDAIRGPSCSFSDTNYSEPYLEGTPNPSAHMASRDLGQVGSTSSISTTDTRQTALSSSDKRAAPGKLIGNQPEKITDLSDYLRKLETEALPTDLDEFNFASPVRAQVATEPPSRQAASTTKTNRTNNDSPNDHTASVLGPPSSVLISDAAEDDPSSASESSFPPDFDRGRYPAQRRRRANKFYTPPARLSESVTSNESGPTVPASQPSGLGSLNKHGAATKLPGSSASHISEPAISQMLIYRVATDPNAKALLEAVASNRASQAQLAEFQALTDEIKTAKRDQEKTGSQSSTSCLTSPRRGSHESWRHDAPHWLGGSSFSRTSSTLVGCVPSKEKGQVQLLKALANRSEGSKASYSGSHRQQNGRWIQGVPRTTPHDSRVLQGRATSELAYASKSSIQGYTTMDSSSSDSFIPDPADHSDIQSTCQRKMKHAGKRPRSTTSAIVRPQAAEQPPLSRAPATALDPHLERLIADLMVNDPKTPYPSDRMDCHPVDYTEQEELLNNKAVLRFADTIPRPCSDKPMAGKPNVTMIETKVIDPARRPERHISSLLRHRELGSDSRCRNVDVQRELRLRRSEMIESWRYWKGASGDIVAAAWGPDSNTYAVGAAGHTNPEDVQYNRPCNLLLGDLADNTLTELPDHRIDRPKPETLADTYNARQAVYEACDPMVYETVSSIAFASTSNRMYTASHDRTVKIWDTSAPQHCLMTLQHDAHVSSVEVSAHVPGLFATGSGVIENAVRVYYTENGYPLHVDFSSSRAKAKPAWKIHPECLRWGSTAYTSHLLLAGFHQNDTDEPSQEGQLCLWDANAFQFIKVVPSSQSVLAAAWHPTSNFFATGGAPGGNLLTDKYKTKTVVRTWDLRAPTHYTMEYECSALDMQDVTFHPINSNIVTAGCTDGTSFVWDYRRPEYPLHRLRHGVPLVDWDHTRGSKEEVDTGVMMSLWGPGGSLFYTGSSDGMIKAWDIRRHPEDVLIRNVAQFGAGIQSGAFSPDGMNLLVGDADGGVHVLSSAPCGQQPFDHGCDDVSPELPITLVKAPDGSGLALDTSKDDTGTAGIEASKQLTDSGQVIFDADIGVTQGPNHELLHADYARREAVDPDAIRLHAKKSSEAKHFFLRTREENEEVESRRRGVIAARKKKIARLHEATQAEVIRDARGEADEGLHNRVSGYYPEYDRSLVDSIDRDGDYPMLDAPSSDQRAPSTWNSILGSMKWPGGHGSSVANLKKAERPLSEVSCSDVEDNIISESEMVEENEWWPRLNEESIEQARKNPRMRVPYSAD